MEGEKLRNPKMDKMMTVRVVKTKNRCLEEISISEDSAKKK